MPVLRAVPHGHVRVATMRHLGALIASLGADASAVFRAARVDEALLADPDAVIPVAVRGRLIALAAEATGCEHFGLLLGRDSGPQQLGVAGQIMLASPTVGEALANLQRYWHLHNATSVILLRRVGDEVEFGCTVLDSNHAGGQIFEDGAMAIAMNLMRHLLGDRWHPSSVHLMRRQPRVAAAYHEFFGAPCRFNAPASLLRFPAACLWSPLVHADAAAGGSLLDRLIVHADADVAPGWFDRARRLTYMLLLQGMCSQSALAQALGTSARTMNRGLARAGTSYLELIEWARFSASRRLIRETDMPLAEIARVLGYAEASSFTRAFRRWAGTSPAAWRRQKTRLVREP